MHRDKLQAAVSYTILYGSLSLANLPAVVSVMWLIPGVVFLEAVIWLILGILAIESLRVSGLWRGFQASIISNWFMMPFVIFAGISVLWSIYWEISLSRWLILLATVAVAGYIGARLRIRHILLALSIFAALVLLTSLALAILVPRTGVMNYHSIQGAWKGVYWHKNHLGIIAAFASILFLTSCTAAFREHKRSAWWWGALYLASLVFLLQTDSVGAYLTLIIVHGVILLALGHQLLRDRLRPIHYLIVLGALVLALVLISASSQSVLAVFNRSPNLTGRVPMWGELFRTFLSGRPVLGYGFNAFWYVDSHRVVMQQLAGYPDEIVIADNGFIDILMGTGLVGLGLFALLYLGSWMRAIQHAWYASDFYGLFPLSVMAYSLVANVSWSLLFENESFLLLVMLVLLFAMPGESDLARESVPAWAVGGAATKAAS